jgi:hypothetical protein
MRTEVACKVAIDLDSREVPDARGEAERERARTRTDLEESVVRDRRDCPDDLVGPGGSQKMLPEPSSRRGAPYACSIDSPRQNFSSISSISSSLMPK